ncbi:hypothetical protein AB0I22_10865 [Streptomyces sp. NPDC050610]|uniref:hypothetical protein n=1 Tax=Streptomyces sp. NPDC050610 TaxID=3157097 RepID=UPI00342951B1
MKRKLCRAAVAVAALAAGAVLATGQADADPMPPARGPGTYATVAYQAVDYQAVGHVVAGRVGQTVPIELGVRNGGPGVAAPDGRTGRGAGAYEITPPEGITITSGAGSCGVKGSRTYVCAIGAPLRPGATDTLRLDVRIDRKVVGAEGEIRVLDGGDAHRDPYPENDAAPILTDIEDTESANALTVTAKPAPPAAALAETGPGDAPLLLAIATGALALGITATTTPPRRHHQ